MNRTHPPHTTTTNLSWWHRWRLGAEHHRQVRRDNKRRNRLTREQDDRKRRDTQRGEKKTTWADRKAWFAQHRALAITLVVIVLSTSAAVPFQFAWFLGRLGAGEHTITAILGAAVITALIEGLTWLAAVLYFDTLTRGPNKIYRIATFGFAGLAAGINFLHGIEISPLVAVAYATASLMGVGAWELYMLRTRYVASGMSADEVRLWASRQWHHRRTVREARRIRATFGLQVSMETAWRMAYLRRQGNPTVPVAVNDRLVDALLGHDTTEPSGPDETVSGTVAEPTSTTPSSVGVDIIECPVDWSTTPDLSSLIGQYWPELEGPGSAPDSSAPEAPESSAASSASAEPEAEAEQPVTSSVPPQKRNNQRNPEAGTGRNQFRPTKTELGGTGNAKERLRKYLARAEANGHPIEELDRNYIAQQFRVSGRYVRDAIANHRDPKEA